MSVSSSAPHDLDLVIDFVNTVDPDADEDQLDTPARLDAWLTQRGLLEPGTVAGEDQRLEAVALREALRALMAAHNGGAEDRAAAAVIESAARRGGLAVHFGADGSAYVSAQAGGIEGALAGLLVPVAEASADGSWLRVKACRAADCRWAFYDRSRNRAGVWCDMAVCGNRNKVRAYRRRKPH